MKYLPVILSAFLVSGCGNLNNQSVGVGKGGVIAAYEGMDRHGAIALFQSEQGKSCYGMIKDALAYTLQENNEQSGAVITTPGHSNANDAIIEQAKAMRQLASDSMKYASHMVAYSNGIIPQDPIVQLAALCKQRGYYDWKTETQAERQKTFRSISSDVTGFLKGASPYAAIGYLGSKIGDRNDIDNSPNAAIGQSNGVSTPIIVEQPEPIIIEPGLTDDTGLDQVIEPPVE